MDDKHATHHELANEYAVAMGEGQKHAFLVRDTGLQSQQVDSLIVLKNRFRRFKTGARNAGDEAAANALFHMQCGLNAMISFLGMWIDLKAGKHQTAWNKLIDAEEYLSIALRASGDGVRLEDFLERLVRAEQVIFPGFPLYNSVGQIIRGGNCTICGVAFNSCEHIEGRVYWGSLCARAQPEIVKIDHVAIVEEPRDRRCIITEITNEDGYYHDYMTGKKIRKDEDKEEGIPGKFTGVIFHNSSIEID